MATRSERNAGLEENRILMPGMQGGVSGRVSGPVGRRTPGPPAMKPILPGGSFAVSLSGLGSAEVQAGATSIMETPGGVLVAGMGSIAAYASECLPGGIAPEFQSFEDYSCLSENFICPTPEEASFFEAFSC